MTDYRKDCETLEALVDRHGVSAVLCMLAEVCGEKAEHLRANWQDQSQARTWDTAASRISKVRLPQFPWQA